MPRPKITDKGSRKVLMTLYLIVPFLIIATIAMFTYTTDVAAWVGQIGKVIIEALAVFTGGNAIENASRHYWEKNSDKPYTP